MELPDKDLYFPRLQFAKFGYTTLGFGGGVSGFVDPYTGTRLKSQGTGARYNVFGGGYISGASYADGIYVKNPFNGTNASETGELEWGKSEVGVASNGTTIIGSGGFNEPSYSSGMHDWADDGSGPYGVSKIEYITSSTGGDAGDWGDVTTFTLGYPGDSGETADDEMRYTGNCVGADGATGFYAGGSARYSPGRAYTNEVWKISLASQSDSEDWGSNLDYWKARQTGMSGYTGTQGTLDTRWLMLGGERRDVTATSAGTTNTYFSEVRYFTFASPSTGTDFGDPILRYDSSTTFSGWSLLCGSNGTRGVAMGRSNNVDVDSGGSPGTGGDTGGAWQGNQGNTIQYWTIASTSNATMFGDMTVVFFEGNGQACNGQYLESWGGYKYNARPNDNAGGTKHNIVDQISIASTGDAVVNGAHAISTEMSTVQNGGTGSN